jgi:hypothetical protein
MTRTRGATVWVPYVETRALVFRSREGRKRAAEACVEAPGPTELMDGTTTLDYDAPTSYLVIAVQHSCGPVGCVGVAPHRIDSIGFGPHGGRC